VDFKKFFLSIVTLFCLSQVAMSDDTGLSNQFSVCMDKSGGVTLYMLDCIGEETNRQDARLNKAYKEIMAQLSPARKKELRKAQRAWIKFRDANCNFYADPDGGTSATLNSNDCFMSSTAARANELENFKK